MLCNGTLCQSAICSSSYVTIVLASGKVDVVLRIMMKKSVKSYINHIEKFIGKIQTVKIDRRRRR